MCKILRVIVSVLNDKIDNEHSFIIIITTSLKYLNLRLIDRHKLI